jgi:hypothetical protein
MLVEYLKMAKADTTNRDLNDGLGSNTTNTELLLALSEIYVVCNAMH